MSSPLNYGTPSSLASIRTPHSLSKNTPHRRRAVISDKHLWQVNVNSDQVDSPVVGSSDTDGVGQNLVIWGTDVVVANCKKKFKEFITKFVGQSINDACSSGDEEQQLIYLKALNQASLFLDPILFL
ncbi:hypothetical protein AAG570_007901 [Ranatra chinensis]|uniref:Uncharacterized protein n=1 Tax=Ranatra chinensis TaxID=642074 RepID=A0ABD0XV57_9HEMI